MNVYNYFTQFEKEMPKKCTALRRTSFALRRAGVNTMEDLRNIQTQTPEKLARVRDIGPQSLFIIDEVVRLYEKTKTAHQPKSKGG